MAVASEVRIGGASDRDATIQQYAPLVKYVVGRLAIGLETPAGRDRKVKCLTGARRNNDARRQCSD